jgi:hypothetical protein
MFEAQQFLGQSTESSDLTESPTRDQVEDRLQLGRHLFQIESPVGGRPVAMNVAVDTIEVAAAIWVQVDAHG